MLELKFRKKMSLVNSLVIGYGNSLRGDDSIGIKVAQMVADWHLPKVRSLSSHQLTPELAAELAQVDLTIFIALLITYYLSQPINPNLTDF
jgi:hypothetical protein